jgi:hypothetical protein
MLRRLQSTWSAVASPLQTANASPAVLALDLDFVLRLLGSKSVADTNTNAAKGPELNISQWAKVKFNTIEVPAQPQLVFSKPHTSTFGNSFKKQLLAPAPAPALKENEESIMNRLQSLADSLPTRISPMAPLSFFDPPESVMKRTKALEEQDTAKQIIKLPTIDYGDRDWSKVTLSSILDKLIPENLKASSSSSSSQATEILPTEITREADHFKYKKCFSLSPLELRLLDFDQFITLAHFYGIKCTNVTDLRIESEILSKFAAAPGPLKRKRASTKPKDGFTWTEVMESLLLRLYDETRSKKQAVDAKFAAFLVESKTTLMKDLRKTSERGLWAVLTEEFSVQAGWKVNTTEIKKKVQVLKCLKVKK